MFNAQKKSPFDSIVGGILLGVSGSKKNYIGLNGVGPTISVAEISFLLDSGNLSIENPFVVKIDGKVFRSSDLDIFDTIKTLVGTTVQQAWFEKEEVNVVLDRAHLIISLKDEDFVSPEAGTYATQSEFFVFSWED
ncbi:MAG: hypothetical protein JNN05_01045 [Candidatus Omnitrophica bacterium]|nr:hypothetical protein [Candidatus Omnitrophota bacterium]